MTAMTVNTYLIYTTQTFGGKSKTYKATHGLLDRIDQSAR
jgi:hypothetical protein